MASVAESSSSDASNISSSSNSDSSLPHSFCLAALGQLNVVQRLIFISPSTHSNTHTQTHTLVSLFLSLTLHLINNGLASRRRRRGQHKNDAIKGLAAKEI